MISKCRTNLNHWDMCSFFCSEVRFRKWFPSRNCNASWTLLLLCLFFSDVSWPHQFASNVCNTFQLTIQCLSKPYPNLYTVRQQTVEHLVFSVVRHSVLFSFIIFWSFCYPRFTYIYVCSASLVSFSVCNTLACLAAKMNGRSVGLSFCWFC